MVEPLLEVIRCQVLVGLCLAHKSSRIPLDAYLCYQQDLRVQVVCLWVFNMHSVNIATAGRGFQRWNQTHENRKQLCAGLTLS